jgi:tRNA nucleotidyltransferase/poly(A) polymerase
MAKQQQTPRVAAVAIIAALREAGFTAYLAGGCVRDALLGIEAKDYDVATDARPEQVRALFKRSKYVGEAFGVVLVYRGGQAIEVATFREEWGYADGRRPDAVAFTDPEHDAARRDFTINGLFADPLTRDPDTGGERIIDYVGGRDDLQAGLIRAIGDPAERFGEDYLRMLRAVRFAARLGFELESKTSAAMVPLAKHLGQISRERIGQELRWVLEGPAPARAAGMIQHHKLDAAVLGEDHLDMPLPTVEALASGPDAQPGDRGDSRGYPLMLAGWMVDRHLQTHGGDRLTRLAQFASGEARRLIKRWRRALCLSNEDRDRLKTIFDLAGVATAWDALTKAQRKRLLATEPWPAAWRLLAAVEMGAGMPQRAAQIERDAAPLYEEGVAPKPLLTGEDLIAAGLEPGPRYGTLLEAAYDAQLEGELASVEQARQWLNDQLAGER